METIVFLLILGAVQCKDEFFFLKDYNPLNYDRKAIESNHRRVRRSTNFLPVDKYIHINFLSHGRNFSLRLSPDSSIFASNHKAYLNEKPVENVDLTFLYHGVDLNDPGSQVYGSVIDGIFDGHIFGSKDHFYIEKTSKYKVGNEKHFRHHSIIYRDDQIDESKLRVKRGEPKLFSASDTGCGLHGSVKSWMRDVQNSVVVERRENETASTRPKKPVEYDDELTKPWLKYSPDARQHVLYDDGDRTGGGKRGKRGVPVKDARTGLYTGRTCTLYLQADHKLYDYVFNHEGQRNSERTRNEIFALFNNHIKAVNAIYESTDFAGTRGINFSVQRTTIWDLSTCPNSDLEDPKKNSFCDDNVDVSNFLNLNSMKNQSDFCLAYVLTSRDFVGGTLGLAWVASTTSSKRDSFGYGYEITSSGGLCEPYKWYSEGSKRVRRSLNTGIITLVNYHNRVPIKVSQLTMAHEIGHNFGSPHDYPASCQPGLPDGNFIMFASATSGDKPNNAKFSPCSVSNISAVLKEVLSQPPNVDQPGMRRNCLIDPETSFCGNGVVEGDEKCDCGYDEDECEQRHDTCCYARTTARKRNEKGCQYIGDAKCSITEGPCCNRNCRFMPAGQTVCRQASDCSQASSCDGQRAACPAPLPKPDKTLCQENTKICNAGSCNKSICELVAMEECFITVGTPEDQCQLSCRNKNDPSAKCTPSAQIAALRPYFLNNRTDAAVRGILQRPGSPCNDYRGYCDIFQKCRSVDSNGPLSRLKNLLFNSETLKTVGDWIQVYWWAVVLMAILLVILMALFIKCCAVHTPSTNPRKPPAQSIYETLRHPTTLLRQGHRHRDAQRRHCSSSGGGNGGGGGNGHHHHHHHHHRHRQRRSQSGGAPCANGGLVVSSSAGGGERRRSSNNSSSNNNNRYSVQDAVVAASAMHSVAGQPLAAAAITVNVAVPSSRPPQVPPAIIVEPPPPYTEREKPLSPAPTGLVAYSGAVTSSSEGSGAGGARPPARGHRKRKRPRNEVAGTSQQQQQQQQLATIAPAAKVDNRRAK